MVISCTRMNHLSLCCRGALFRKKADATVCLAMKEILGSFKIIVRLVWKNFLVVRLSSNSFELALQRLHEWPNADSAISLIIYLNIWFIYLKELKSKNVMLKTCTLQDVISIEAEQETVIDLYLYDCQPQSSCQW